MPSTPLLLLPGPLVRRGSCGSPSWVLAGQPEDQGLDVRAGGRAAGLAAHGLRRLAAAGDVAVLAQDRLRGGQQPQTVAARLGITPSRAAGRARSAQFSSGRRD